VVFELDIAKDYALLSEAGNSEECSFRISLVIEYYIYRLGDLPCFIGGTVYIVHQYGTRDALGTNTLHVDKVFIYEVARSSEV